MKYQYDVLYPLMAKIGNDCNCASQKVWYKIILKDKFQNLTKYYIALLQDFYFLVSYIALLRELSYTNIPQGLSYHIQEKRHSLRGCLKQWTHCNYENDWALQKSKTITSPNNVQCTHTHTQRERQRYHILVQNNLFKETESSD